MQSTDLNLFLSFYVISVVCKQLEVFMAEEVYRSYFHTTSVLSPEKNVFKPAKLRDLLEK